MNFLNPAAIAIAAGLTIPPLIALYFLKLKRAVRRVPSTLLWKQSVEDLRVNSPFQRLRSSLLLVLQLLVLLLAAAALGKPMFRTAQAHESTIIIMIDQSASMGVVEADGRSRLERAKEQARLCVDGMADNARAMVIAFCDRATVVSSFDTDREALKRKIDSIEPTQSSSTLGEAMSLAEAYTQNIVIGGEEAGTDRPPDSIAPPASVFMFTDGRVQDAESVALQKFDVDKIHITNVGTRNDNVAIIAMDARRNYERPRILEVTATVENYGPEPVTLDAVLYVGGQNVDVQTVRLGSGSRVDVEEADSSAESPGESVAVAAFDEVEFEGGGVVEVVLRVDDALPADDRAWTIIEEPRHVRVLLVTEGNWLLESVLSTLPITLVTMTPYEYEKADDKTLLEGERSAFDLVMMDRHSTARLPQGNYFFWGAIPQMEGVRAGRIIDDEVIFNWDDTHPILRYVAVEAVVVDEWLEVKLPPEAVIIIDGETTPVMGYFSRRASQFLISAFGLTREDELGSPMLNTLWAVASPDFVVFMQNAVQYLSGSVATIGKKSVRPGQPVTLPIRKRTERAKVYRPDGTVDSVTCAGQETIHYARTRMVGTYRVEPGAGGSDVFAVNLFNPVESRVEPAPTLTLGAETVDARAGTIEVNQPVWHYFVLAMLGLVLLEWIVYNQRVFV